MMERAQTEPQRGSDDDLEEVFFSGPPPAFEGEIEPWAPQPMSAANRRAMKATVVMLGCTALCAVGFVAFSELVMVFPVPLSAHAQMPRHDWPPAVEQPRPAAGVAAAVGSAASAAKVDDGNRAAAQANVAVPAVQESAAPPAAVPSEPAVVVAPAAAPAVAASNAQRSARRAARPVSTPRRTRPAREVPATGGIAPALRGGAMSIGPAAQADQLVRRASSELGRGDAREAQQLASQAILLDPKRSRAYIVLGAARDALGDSSGKRAAFQACVRNATDALVSTCRTLAR